MSKIPYFIRREGVNGASFKDLAHMARRELEALRGGAEIVCGPISTGGYGNAVVNLLVFNHAIEVLKGHGRPMWSQMPYEAGIALLHDEWCKRHPGEYCIPIMTDFYWPIMTPELIRRAWFLDGERGWKSSTGATMEWERLGELGIERRCFKEEWHCRCRLPHLD